MMKNPQDCKDMVELREAIDHLDQNLMGLLAKRARFIDRAAELKTENGWPARITDRVEEVAGNARRNAENSGFDPDLAESLWRTMIEWSIAREERVLGRTG